MKALFGLDTVPKELPWQSGVGVDRQHHSNSLCQQALGHTILGTVRTDAADNGLVHKVSGVPENLAHYRGVECILRQFV